jgi:predicted RNase H-like HicB family nuclease
MQHQQYAMIIEWSDEDEAYLVSIPDLPGTHSHADTPAEAAREGERLIEEWLEIAREHGWAIPQPSVHVAI